MFNFYLFEKAFDLATPSEFDHCVLSLNEVVNASDQNADSLIRSNEFLNLTTQTGYLSDLIHSSQIGKLFWTMYRRFVDVGAPIGSIEDFDSRFSLGCNGMLGHDFANSDIPLDRQVVNLASYIEFKKLCQTINSTNDVERVFNTSGECFLGLVFCDSAINYIKGFSPDDDRVRNIVEKLAKLNSFALNWSSGQFMHYEMGLSVSPDTKNRLKKSASTRVFVCPDGETREFSWHIKLSAGTEYRIYYSPDGSMRKVFIGVVGTKSEVGF